MWGVSKGWNGMPLYTEAQTFDRYDLKVGHQTTPDQGRGEETEEEEQKQETTPKHCFPPGTSLFPI